MPNKIIACEVMKEELLAIEYKEAVEFEFVSMDFHVYPEKLKKELQRILDESIGYSRVILAFGLCGGATKDMKASDCILTIPKVHDCIPILLGSKDRFEKIRKKEKGTFYHTCGWVDGMRNVKGDRSILAEYKRIYNKYGEKKAESIFKRMYEGYRRVLFIHTGNSREFQSLKRSTEVAMLLKLEHEETFGNKIYFEKIVNGPWDEDDFINVPANGMIEESYFFE